MTIKQINPDVSGDYKEVFNSEDFKTPEFTIEVKTSFGKYQLEAYNVTGTGFVLENEFMTPTLCNNREQLPIAIEESISKLENNLDTMT